MTESSSQAIRAYHERTQHHLHGYARSLGYLDWATQPDPFRRYASAPRTPLPLRDPDGTVSYRDVCAGAVAPAVLDLAAVARLFEDSLALSAWKEHGGSRWPLRVNPSSGNLHPTEGYLLCGPVPELTAGPALYHYAPDEHALELRAAIPADLWQRIAGSLPEGSVLVGLASIPWRESWKYGERAYRYCMQDLGHALAALGFAAKALGWRAALLALPDEQLAALLGIDAQEGPEAEHPDALLWLHPLADPLAPAARAFGLAADTRRELESLAKLGVPAPLSDDHQPWPVIDEAIAATRLVSRATPAFWDRPAGGPATLTATPDRDARALFRQRRSAVAMDGKTGIAAATLLATLARACDPGSPALDLLPWRGRVHLLLFVHRVEGLPSGIYLLARGGRDPAWLRPRMRGEFLWERAPGAPASLPLYLLLPIDCRDAARTVCCHQQIAADSAYAVAMLAELGPALDELGAWGWRLMHWEAGAIGQLLYLDAEAAGVRATGIGCFFDSAVHELCAIRDDDLRTIYHFTVGGAVDDPRLRTEPPYGPGRRGPSPRS